MTAADARQAITRQLAAIEMPPPPDWQPLIVTAAIIVLVVIATFIAYWLRQQATRPQNIRSAATTELNRLHQQWQEGELDDQRAAYRLCAVLRIGLQMRQLTDTPPPQLKKDAQQWRQALAQLSELRYARATNARLDKQLFEQIGHWLSQEARPC